MKQNLLQKELLDKAAAKYAANIYQAEDYLASRGITREVARLARFGVVGEPEVGHEAFQGRLSIPYITKPCSTINIAVKITNQANVFFNTLKALRV